MSSSRILKPDSLLGKSVETYRFDTMRGAMPSQTEGGTSAFVPFLETVFGDSPTGWQEDAGGTHAPGEEEIGQALAVIQAPPGIPEEEHLALVQEAYGKGFEEGKRQAERGLSSVFKALREAVDEVSGLREQVLRDCEDDLLKLAVLVARKVIHQEITTDRLILAKIVAAAVNSSSERDEIVIRLNPEDHRLVVAHKHLYLNGFSDERVLDLKADDSVTPGGCIVDTAMGEIDARTDSQVDEIFRRLMEERKTLLSIPPDLVVEREHHAYEEN
jgi:flagellar assembly protein FliH